jgi:hypothetical protein
MRSKTYFIVVLPVAMCRELEDAITWACHLQEELMYLSWPSHLLSMQECRWVYCSCTFLQFDLHGHAYCSHNLITRKLVAECLGLHWQCREQHDADGRLIWRGLRVRVGMSYGFVNNKKPLNTGRADYFGVLPNGAARVSALAAPGQV